MIIKLNSISSNAGLSTSWGHCVVLLSKCDVFCFTFVLFLSLPVLLVHILHLLQLEL